MWRLWDGYVRLNPGVTVYTVLRGGHRRGCTGGLVAPPSSFPGDPGTEDKAGTLGPDEEGLWARTPESLKKMGGGAWVAQC